MLMVDELIDLNVAEMLKFDEAELKEGNMVLLIGFGASKVDLTCISNYVLIFDLIRFLLIA